MLYLGQLALSWGYTVYVTLVGNGLLPKRLRFTNYKLFMRTSYVLYMLATFLGVVIYIVVFVYGI